MTALAAAARRGVRSAGILAYRHGASEPEFLLVHPGGPFWRTRDIGAWSIPKGLVDEGEDELSAARREFREEVGIEISGTFKPLGEITQKGGKRVACWLVEADFDLTGFCSNTFELEWPKGSGRKASFPECDQAAYIPSVLALEKILPVQRRFIEAALATMAAE